MSKYEKLTLEFDTSRLMQCVREKAEHDFKKIHIKDEIPTPSLRALEEATGISASTLSRIDNGHIPDMETYMKLCEYLTFIPSCFTFIEWVGKPRK